jgi:hypothetical protein
MNAITRPYTISYPMDGHEPHIEPFNVGRHVHTRLRCECDWRAGVSTPPNKSRAALNLKYQDHLVAVMEGKA